MYCLLSETAVTCFLPSVCCNEDVLIEAGPQLQAGVWLNCTNSRGLLFKDLRYTEIYCLLCQCYSRVFTDETSVFITQQLTICWQSLTKPYSTNAYKFCLLCLLLLVLYRCYEWTGHCSVAGVYNVAERNFILKFSVFWNRCLLQLS